MAKYIDREQLIEWLKKIPLKDLTDGLGICRVIMEDDFKRAIKSIPEGAIVDAVPVVHGRWIFTKRHLWYKDENGNIDEWRVDNGFHNGPECQICHTAFCEHCTPDWSTTECEIGHYYCSECAETSRDAHENYCPNCGAKMNGGDSDADYCPVANTPGVCKYEERGNIDAQKGKRQTGAK